MMKILICINIMIMSLLACNAKNLEHDAICGTFYKFDKDKHFSTSYTLELNADSTFTFIIKVKDGQPQCSGVWEIVEDKFILLLTSTLKNQ